MHRNVPGSGTVQLPYLGFRYWLIITAVGGGGGGSTGSYYFSGHARGGGQAGGSGAWARNFMFPTFGGFSAPWEVGAGGAGGIGGASVHNSGQTGGRTLFNDLELGGGIGGAAAVGVTLGGSFDILLKNNMYYQGSTNTPGGEVTTTASDSLRLHYINSQRDNIGHGFYGGLGGTDDDNYSINSVAGSGPVTVYTAHRPGDPSGGIVGGGGGGASFWGRGGDGSTTNGSSGTGYGTGGAGATLVGTDTNDGAAGKGGFLIVQWMSNDSFKSNSSGWRR